MLTYYVHRREVWIQTVEIAADTEEDALRRVVDGEGENTDLFEYSHTCPSEGWTVSIE